MRIGQTLSLQAIFFPNTPNGNGNLNPLCGKVGLSPLCLSEKGCANMIAAWADVCGNAR